MFHSKLPQKYWVEAFFTANFLSNLLLHSALESTHSPYERLHKRKPDYRSLHVFGCACYPMLLDYTHHKLDPKSLQCVFLGYNEKYKGYRCLLPTTRRVYISSHVIFDENHFPFGAEYSKLHPHPKTPLAEAWQKSALPTQPPAPKPTKLVNAPIFFIPQQVPAQAPLFTAADFPPLPSRTSPPNPPPSVASSSGSTPCVGKSTGCTSGSDPVSIGNSFAPTPGRTALVEHTTPQATHPMITRAKDGITKPNPRYVLLTQKASYSEPRTLAEALKHPGWNNSIHKGIGNSKETETWSLVPYKEGMNVLGNRWVHRVKLNADGTVKSLRSRLVAKGYNQSEGVDYLETYSHVVRSATVRMILHTAIVMKWNIKQMDVKNAFLHGDLTETVYMKQPAGFIEKDKPNHVCLLHKALYGLKQSPRAWFDKFSSYIIEFGFVCSYKDPSLFVYSRGKNVIMLLLYVDDMLITGNSSAVMDKFLDALNKQFKMKDLGQMHYFLGIQATFHSNGLFLNQQQYAENILAVASMSDCNPIATPLPAQLNQIPQRKELFSNPTYYRTLAGKLQYLTLTRPDIQYSVNYICKKMHSPTVSDFDLLKRILRYVRGTTDMGINFTKETDCVVRAYSDSDWGGCPSTHRSTRGFCTFLGSNLISWSSLKQPSVSRSSTEAEYRSLSQTATELH